MSSLHVCTFYNLTIPYTVGPGYSIKNIQEVKVPSARTGDKVQTSNTFKKKVRWPSFHSVALSNILQYTFNGTSEHLLPNCVRSTSPVLNSDHDQ